MKEKIANNILLCFALFLAILSPLLVHFFINAEFNTLDGDNNTWISFWGSYLGGVFTLIAVLITVYESREALRIGKEANRINIIKNEKDLIYNINKEAIQIVLNYEIIDPKSMEGKRYKGLDAISKIQDVVIPIFEKEFPPKSEDEIFDLNFYSFRAHDILSRYQLPISIISTHLDNYENESIRFLNDINSATSPLEIEVLCMIIIKNGDKIIRNPEFFGKHGDDLVTTSIQITELGDALKNYVIKRESNK